MIESKLTCQNRNSGFSLLEVLVAIAIFALAASEMLPAFNSFTGRNSYSHVKVGALQAAEQVLDELRSVDPSSLPSSGNDGGQNVTVGNDTFVATTYYCPQAALCSGLSTRHLKVDVSKNDQSIIKIETVFTALR